MKKADLVAICKGLLGNNETENYICKAKTLPSWHVIPAAMVQRAVKSNFN